MDGLADIIIKIIDETRDIYRVKCKELISYRMALKNAEKSTYEEIDTKINNLSIISEMIISGSSRRYYSSKFDPEAPDIFINLDSRYCGSIDLLGYVSDNQIGLNYYMGNSDPVLSKFLDCVITHAKERHKDKSFFVKKKSHRLPIHSAGKEVPIPVQS